MSLILITGPVRSGKSSLAARFALESGLRVFFVATAPRYDDPEWIERITRHRDERPSGWETIETARWSNDDAIAFVRDAGASSCLLVDAIGTYVAARIDQHLAVEADDRALHERVESETMAFADALLSARAHVVAVGEQVGWDVVPERSSVRMFRDILGRVQRRLAARASRAYLVVSGYALDLHLIGTPIEDFATAKASVPEPTEPP